MRRTKRRKHMKRLNKEKQKLFQNDNWKMEIKMIK
jgi:hypothetical protein